MDGKKTCLMRYAYSDNLRISGSLVRSSNRNAQSTHQEKVCQCLLNAFFALWACGTHVVILLSVATRIRIFENVPHGFHILPDLPLATEAHEEMIDAIKWITSFGG